MKLTDAGQGSMNSVADALGVPVSANALEPELVEHIIAGGEGRVGHGGAVLVETGDHTGRSPNDKFIVGGAGVSDRLWREANREIPPEAFDLLLADMTAHMKHSRCHVQDLLAGADPKQEIRVRVVAELAWHALFIRHLLRRPASSELAGFVPHLTIINAPSFRADPDRHGCRSETVVAINIERRIVLIGGTAYAGETKKSVFSFLNWHLPARGVLSMHCSANHACGDPDDSAIFFGLSGTGKTTLSSDRRRVLIGDDEHGWSDDGIFNIEGGCYAKTVKLDAEAEPEIHSATSKFATVIENVVFDPKTRALDFVDTSITENTRCAYPLEYIPGASRTGMAGHPRNIFMLTCDAFGVLPPIARLTPPQAMYHFLSGFTAKVAGTEQGVREPEPVFSTCFGSPFLPLRPEVYGDLLRSRIKSSGATCWLVNTGWTGGGYGEGSRMPILVTRTLLNAALKGTLARSRFKRDRIFGFEVPVKVPGVPRHLLEPRRTWEHGWKYDQAAERLVGMFAANFERFSGAVDEEVLRSAVGAK